MTPKNSKRGVNRRATQNKRSGQSSLTERGTATAVWNTYSQQFPHYNNTLKKDNAVHRFIQSLDFGAVLTTSTTLPTFYARSFTFNDVQQVSSFTAVFDQYRIDELELWLYPDVSNSASTTNPTYYSAIDYDDANAPTALGSLQQYTNVIETTMNNGHYMRFRPHVAIAAYSGAFTSFMNQKSNWIDSGSPGVQHYGIKAGFNITGSTVNIRLMCRIHFSCRNVF